VADRAIDDLAAAVVDRDSIDWSNVAAHVSDTDRRTAEELKRLSFFLGGSADNDLFSPLRRRLPIWTEAIRWLAMLLAAGGLAGTLLALQQLDTSRPAVALVPFIFAVLLAFSSAAFLLDWFARDRRARALAFCYWTIATAFGAGGITWLKGSVAPWLRMFDGLRPEVFLGAGLWLFALEFPRTTRYSRVDTLSRFACSLAALSGAVLFIGNALAGWFDALPPGVPRSAIRQAAPGGWFWNVDFAMVLPALVVVALRSRAAPAGEVARVRLFLSALVLALVPVAVLVMVSGVAPDLARRLSQEWRIASAWAVYPPLLLLPFATMYAVTATNVLPVRLVIRAGVRYVVGGRILFVAVAVPAMWLGLHAYDNRRQTLAEVLADPLTTRLVWVLGAATLLLVCRRLLLSVLDRWAGADSPPAQTLARLAATLKDARTPLEVSTVLAAGIEQAFQAPSERYLIRLGRLAPVGTGVPLPEKSLIPLLLRGAAEPCLIGEGLTRSLFDFLPTVDQMWVSRSGIAAVVPVIARRGGGELLGMVTLGHRRNAFAFEPSDLQFLRTSAASAALACDALDASALAGEPRRDEVAVECPQCGLVADWNESGLTCACGGSCRPAALPKRLVGRFEITRRLGIGGMGVVYLAVDRTLDRQVAVKTLTWLSQPAAERSLAEARAMANLTHPNIAVLYGSELWQSTPVLLMEYLQGGTLARRIQVGALQPTEAVRIALLLSSALESVHANGRCHGDIKPSNIGFTAEGTPKLLDFGLSRSLATVSREGVNTSSQRPLSAAWGTPAYLSPEAWAGAGPDEHLDLWALSVVLAEMAAGRHPYGTARSRGDIERRSAQTISRLRERAPTALCNLLEEVLCSEERGRPRSATEMRDRLREVAGHLS
jgi:hypothetical protein